jgi:hypothetical protein
MSNNQIIRVLCAIGVAGAVVGAAQASADAAVIRVPADQPTVQAAVDAAEDGDLIKVGPGRWCGATIDREVHLVGHWGTTVEGCAEMLQPFGLRAGFVLVDARASGTSIRGFHFDGAGISTSNTDPIGLAIIGRDAHGVSVTGNRIEGTTQGITNTGGDGWLIAGNVIRDLTIFGCVVQPGRCGGGVGIVIQQRDVAADRAFGNVILFNEVGGITPDGLSIVYLAGVFVLGQDHPFIAFNRIAIPGNPNAPADAIGINVSDVCCGDPTPLPTTRHAVIVHNDGRATPTAVQVDRDASNGTGNSQGAVIRHNRGVVRVDGVVVSFLSATAGARPSPMPLD